MTNVRKAMVKAQSSFQSTSVFVQQVTIGVFVLLWIMVLAVVDVFAFENGATATISQATLAFTRKYPLTTHLWVAFFVGLTVHLTIPRDPGNIPDPPLWKPLLGYIPAAIMGAYIAYTWLYQRPNVD